MRRLAIAAVCLALSAFGCAKPAAKYNVVIRHGTIYDGTGAAGKIGDVAILDDRIEAIGDLAAGHGREEFDATGMAVAPGFINMLSHSETSLIEDGHAQGTLRQGVTLEVFGESSMGPLTDQMAQDQMERQGDIKFNISWRTLGGYLDHLVARGISTNVASFVSAATVRANEIGLDNRAPTPAELDRMRALVRTAMDEGAMGLTTALIYIPGVFAKTDELVELAKVASASGGMYISHMRSEGDRLLEAIDETLTIARQAKIRAEIYHLKESGQSNWNKLDPAIAKIDGARKDGLEITADMYTYTAGSTGLDAAMPPWVQEGGYKKWAERLQDPKIRDRVRREMTAPSPSWENLMLAAGGKGTLLVGFKNEALREYAGKTLEDVATLRGKSVQDTAMDLVVEDGSRVQVVYFLMSEDNVKRQIQLPWVELRIRRLVDGAGRRVHQDQHASARLRQLRAPAREVRARRARHPHGRSHPQADPAAGDDLAHQGPRQAREGVLRRYRRVRSENHRGHVHVRKAALVRGWRETRLGQRWPGAQGRRAHRGKTGACHQRPRLQKSEVRG